MRPFCSSQTDVFEYRCGFQLFNDISMQKVITLLTVGVSHVKSLECVWQCLSDCRRWFVSWGHVCSHSHLAGNTPPKQMHCSALCLVRRVVERSTAMEIAISGGHMHVCFVLLLFIVFRLPMMLCVAGSHHSWPAAVSLCSKPAKGRSSTGIA